ncbi:Nudix hydrolase domain-containing protein [Trichostrongylus colubriformis]|uniref:Nudix hydrolase domain-containing protein n=1 Tax=Trichostrongylus colubriformis TaxID=6319 RepID=A0AAN8FPB0_TRICO
MMAVLPVVRRECICRYFIFHGNATTNRLSRAEAKNCMDYVCTTTARSQGSGLITLTLRSAFIIRICNRNDMVIPYDVNQYGDAVIYSKSLPRDLVEKEFANEIVATYGYWKAKGINAVWVYINLEDCHVVPDLAKLGFIFAHAAPDELTMTRWLGEEPSRLPLTTFSYFSVHGMVVDEKGRVLMIREHRRKYVWMFPGGMPESNENLFETAERKVLEETGVVAKAESVISLRQRLRTEYEGACGFFFGCLMKPVRDSSSKDAGGAVSDVVVAMRWFTRDELKALPKQQFFRHHYTIWKAYENSLESGTSKELSKADDDSITSHLFNFGYF